MISTKISHQLHKYILIRPKVQNVKTTDKAKIMKLFRDKIKNRYISIEITHCGSIGHWLEQSLGVTHNASNTPDIYGYEIKKSSSKITFGDFSASEYLYSKKTDELNKINNFDCKKIFSAFTRSDFIKTFGTHKKEKNRFSWSGSCVPNYPSIMYNKNGLKFVVTKNKDIVMYYSYLMDKTYKDKKYIERLCSKNKQEYKDIAIVVWKREKMENHINIKFNQKGFILFDYNKEKAMFTKLYFGKPLNFNTFIENFENGTIFFDSGMYDTNSRNYSLFRSQISFWEKLIYAKY